ETAGARYVAGENNEAEELLSLRSALAGTASPAKVELSAPSILGSAYIPPQGLSVFRAGLKPPAKKYNMMLPLFGQDLQNLYYDWPQVNLKKSGDKQKMLKLLDDYSNLIQKVDGELVGTDGEGRLKSRFALNTFDDETLKLFSDIKA